MAGQNLFLPRAAPFGCNAAIGTGVAGATMRNSLFRQLRAPPAPLRRALVARGDEAQAHLGLS